MNKKGLSAFFIFMMIVVIIILMLALAKPLTQTSSDAQGVNGLDCGNATAYQDKANCTSTDSLPFLYFLVGLGFVGVLIKALGNG